MPKELWLTVKAQARREGKKLHQAVIEALTDWLKREGECHYPVYTAKEIDAMMDYLKQPTKFHQKIKGE